MKKTDIEKLIAQAMQLDPSDVLIDDVEVCKEAGHGQETPVIAVTLYLSKLPANPSAFRGLFAGAYYVAFNRVALLDEFALMRQRQEWRATL